MSSIHEAFLIQKHPTGTLLYTYNYEMAIALLNGGADPDELNEDGMNALHLICKIEPIKMYLDLVKKNYKNLANDPLQDYIENMIKVLEMVLSKTKDVNKKVKEDYSYKKEPEWTNLYEGNTALHFAIYTFAGAFYDKKDIEKQLFTCADLRLELLLKAGADKSIKNGRGWNANETVNTYHNPQNATFKKRIQKILDKY